MNFNEDALMIGGSYFIKGGDSTSINKRRDIFFVEDVIDTMMFSYIYIYYVPYIVHVCSRLYQLA